MNKFLAFLVILQLTAKVSSSMDLVLLQDYPEAQCLDGSTAGIYWQAGFGEGIDKFIVFMEGGGACQGATRGLFLEDCIARVNSRLGSNQFWNQTQEGTGMLSNDPAKNPQFYNWNQAFINYCTGVLHGGYQKKPVRVNLFKHLYFKGNNVTMQTFNFLLKEQNLSSSSIAILAGFSAGGCGVYKWANYFRDLLPQSTQVFALPDSGYFMNYIIDVASIALKVTLKTTYDSLNDIYPLQCPYRTDKQNAYQCLTQQDAADLVQVPMLVVNSQYDYWELNQMLQFKCVEGGTLKTCCETEMALIENYRNQFVAAITLLTKGRENRGAFLPACVVHGLTTNEVFGNPDWAIPENSNNTVDRIIQKFIFEEFQVDENKLFYSDDVSWPGNTRCSNAASICEQLDFSDWVSPQKPKHGFSLWKIFE